MYTMRIKMNFVFSMNFCIEQSLYSCFNYIKENLVLASNTYSTGIIDDRKFIFLCLCFYI